MSCAAESLSDLISGLSSSPLSSLVSFSSPATQYVAKVLSPSLSLPSDQLDRLKHCMDKKRKDKKVNTKSSPDVELHASELKRLESLRLDTSGQLERLRLDLEKTNLAAEEMSELALDVVEQEERFPLLQAKRNYFHIVTRTVFEKVSTHGNAVKGFVMIPSKNDVAPFTLDRRDLGEVTANDFLWDYIEAGVASKWKKAF